MENISPNARYASQAHKVNIGEAIIIIIIIETDVLIKMSVIIMR
jgi:hypothetical protein